MTLLTSAHTELHADLTQVARRVWVDEKHRFGVTPEVYPLTPGGKRQLDELGEALRIALPGIGRIAAIAASDELAKNRTYSMIQTALWNSVPKQYFSLGIARPNTIPASLKVDLMEGEDGTFYVAEIDGHNERGLGYTILTARMRDVIAPGARTLPGIGKLYAREVLQRRRGDSILLIFSNRERFYLPEFTILQEELARFGVTLHLGSDQETSFDGSRFRIKGTPVDSSLLVYHPPVMYNNGLCDALSRLYIEGEIDFLIPPKPFMGSKAILAILRNDEGDPTLEAVLHSQIRADALKVVRRHIPETVLLHNKSSYRGRDLCGGFVLKKTIASGMKGTYFNDDPDFLDRLGEALTSRYGYVLQREVKTKLRDLRSFTDDGELRSTRCHTRMIVYYIGREVADIVVTALPRKAVHGAPDSIFLGAVLTDH